MCKDGGKASHQQACGTRSPAACLPGRLCGEAGGGSMESRAKAGVQLGRWATEERGTPAVPRLEHVLRKQNGGTGQALRFWVQGNLLPLDLFKPPRKANFDAHLEVWRGLWEGCSRNTGSPPQMGWPGKGQWRHTGQQETQRQRGASRHRYFRTRNMGMRDRAVTTPGATV